MGKWAGPDESPGRGRGLVQGAMQGLERGRGGVVYARGRGLAEWVGRRGMMGVVLP